MSTRTGQCVGGPLDGRTMTTRSIKGILYVNRPTNSAWIYDWTDDEKLVVRSEEPEPLVDDDENSPVSRWRAAREDSYDVISALGDLDVTNNEEAVA